MTCLPHLEIERAFQSVRLFETFYSSEINLLARAIETVHFNDKECIYRQGDPGDYYYLILKGRVNCQMQVCIRYPYTFPHYGYSYFHPEFRIVAKCDLPRDLHWPIFRRSCFAQRQAQGGHHGRERTVYCPLSLLLDDVEMCFVTRARQVRWVGCPVSV
jgi:hypothetical protein